MVMLLSLGNREQISLLLSKVDVIYCQTARNSPWYCSVSTDLVRIYKIKNANNNIVRAKRKYSKQLKLKLYCLQDN